MLVDLFGSTRDEWIKSDIQGWLAPNRMYDGVVAPVREAFLEDASQEVYIVTTKQQRFTIQLLNDMAGIPFPPERVMSQTESGRPKTERLLELESLHPGRDYVFVEDKLSTLEKVCQAPELDHWKLYLVDWGYNQQHERERAAANPRIKVIGVTEFAKLCQSHTLV